MGGTGFMMQFIFSALQVSNLECFLIIYNQDQIIYQTNSIECQILALTIGTLDVFPGTQAFILKEMVSSATEFNNSTIKLLK